MAFFIPHPLQIKATTPLYHWDKGIKLKMLNIKYLKLIQTWNSFNGQFVYTAGEKGIGKGDGRGKSLS